MKRFISIILAMLFIVAILPLSTLAANPSYYVNPFKDVYNSKWYKDVVVYAYYHGYMTGTANAVFEPETTLTRGMVVTMMANMHNVDVSQYAYRQSFTDTAKGKWYHDAVEWAKATGVVSGTSATTFAPKANVTVQDLCVMLYSYAKYCGFNTTKMSSLNAYSDASKVSSYALTAVKWAVANKIIGINSTLTPKAYSTRAYVAYAFYQFDQNVGHKWVENVLTTRTCTTDGKIKYTCSDCGKTRYSYPKAWHVWSSSKVTGSSSDGCIVTHYCALNNSHTYTSTQKHDWIIIEDVPADCYYDDWGYKRYQCKHCFGTYSIDIAPEHSYDYYGMCTSCWSSVLTYALTGHYECSCGNYINIYDDNTVDIDFSPAFYLGWEYTSWYWEDGNGWYIVDLAVYDDWGDQIGTLELNIKEHTAKYYDYVFGTKSGKCDFKRTYNFY